MSNIVLARSNLFMTYGVKNGGNQNIKTYIPQLKHAYGFDGNVLDNVSTQHGTSYGINYVEGAGIIGSAASLIPNSYISIGAPTDFNRAAKIGGCSYECRVLFNEWGSAWPNLGVLLHDEVGWACALWSKAPGEIEFNKFIGSDVRTVASGFSLNTWLHIIGVIDANYRTKLYIQGQLIATNSNTIIPSNIGGSILIGKHSGVGAKLNALIDYARLYTTPLTQNNVTFLYNNGNGRR